MRRRISLALATSAALLALTACTGGGGQAAPVQTGGGEITGEVSLQTWSLTPKFTGYLKETVAAFEKEYPGTKVKLIDQPGDGYSDKVLTQAASGTMPDVVNLPPDFTLPLVGQKMLLDVATVDPTLEQTYVPGSLAAFQFRGSEGTYAYPWYLNTDVNYWNTDKFEKCGLDPAKVPATTAELFEQAEVMHEACPKEYLLSRKPGLGDLALSGAPILSADGTKFEFNTPEAAALVDQYAQAFQKGLMPSSVLSSDYLGNSLLFTKGEVAWTTGGATSIPDFERDNPSLKGSVVASPALDIAPLYAQGLAVSANSKNQATAVALAKWMTNSENQAAFAHLVNVFPSTIESAKDPFFSKSNGTAASDAKVIAFKALETAKNMQPYEVNSAMSDYAGQQIALAIRGDISSQDALDKAVERLNEMLERQK